jgi:hypothetical protein
MEKTLCPLCVRVVSLSDLTFHLTTSHGVVPQSAVNSLLLWVLTTSNFASNNNNNNNNNKNNENKVSKDSAKFQKPPPANGGNQFSQSFSVAHGPTHDATRGQFSDDASKRFPVTEREIALTGRQTLPAASVGLFAVVDAQPSERVDFVKRPFDGRTAACNSFVFTSFAQRRVAERHAVTGRTSLVRDATFADAVQVGC